MAPTINEMKQTIVHLYDELNKMNLDIFNEVFAPDFVSYGWTAFQDVHGPEAYKDTHKQFLSTFPDLQIRVEDVIADGNLCGTFGTLSGTHEGNFMGMAPATHKRITWTGAQLFRFNDAGLIDARWQEWDGVSVMQQLGVMPSPTPVTGEQPYPVPPLVVGKRVSSPSENAAIMRRFIEEVWNKGNMAVADEIFHADATSPSAPMLPNGPAAVKMLAGMFRQAMPDYHMEILQLLADSDRVFARFSQSGTQTGELMGVPASGKKATWTEMGILRFAGGQVVESWYSVDMLGLMQQISTKPG